MRRHILTIFEDFTFDQSSIGLSQLASERATFDVNVAYAITFQRTVFFIGDSFTKSVMVFQSGNICK